MFVVNWMLKMPCSTLEDPNRLQKLADKFRASRIHPNSLTGCVVSVHRIAIAIEKPPDNYNPRNFY